MNEKSLLQRAIDMVDTQVDILVKSKKGKDAKYKFGADAAITNLIVVKMNLKSLMLENNNKQL